MKFLGDTPFKNIGRGILVFTLGLLLPPSLLLLGAWSPSLILPGAAALVLIVLGTLGALLLPVILRWPLVAFLIFMGIAILALGFSRHSERLFGW